MISDLEEQLKAKNKWISQLLDHIETLQEQIELNQKRAKWLGTTIEESNDFVLKEIDSENEKLEVEDENETISN